MQIDRRHFFTGTISDTFALLRLPDDCSLGWISVQLSDFKGIFIAHLNIRADISSDAFEFVVQQDKN